MSPSPFYFLVYLTIFFTTNSHSSPLHFPLTHTLSTFNFPSSHHHLLKSTTTTSTTRHRHRHRRQISLPLAPGSDYTLTFSLNSQTISVYMDTGSDIVWFPCSPFDCILCEGKFEPGTLNPINITQSSLITCKSRACSSVHKSLPSSDLCAMAKCPLEDIEISDCENFHCPSFYYAYGDGSFVGNLHVNDLIIPSNSITHFVLRNFTFGCSHSSLGEPIGVAGFGPGFLSLPAQLGNLSPDLGTQFSYCLVSHSFDSNKLKIPSPLFLGKFEGGGTFDGVSGFVYTPMLDNPKYPYFYTVGLEGVSVGSSRVMAPGLLKRVDGVGNGGVVVDSGTTYSMLPRGFYNSVVAELDRRVGRVLKRANETELRTGLSPCYYMGGKSGLVVMPSLVLHFGGNASVVLPRRNYVHEFMDGGDEKKGEKVGCFMMMDGGDDDDGGGGPGATLGNYQQQGFEVVYDLEMGRVGFAKRKCASLWKNLNKN